MIKKITVAKKALLLYVFCLSLTPLFAQYTYVYFQNNTPFTLESSGIQSGGSLSSSYWWAFNGTINQWQKEKEVMWMSRDGGITNGVDFFFNLKLKSGSDSLYLKVKLNGNFIGSDMWQSISADGISDPWFSDRSFHEQTFIFQGKSVSLKYVSYFTGGYDDLRFVLHLNDPYEVDTASQNANNVMNVLAYNIFMLAPPISSSDQTLRASEMSQHVQDYDALVFSEAFYNSARTDELIPDLSVEYPYHTNVVDESGSLEDGGVMIFSKYPIEFEQQMIYSDCDGSDCFASKGVMYAKINKMGKKYHLFGTHTQAWPDAVDVAVRINQFKELNAFIESRNIPQNEAVIIAGDLNVDKIANVLNEYNGMLDSLNVIEPSYMGFPLTYDVNSNNYASSGQEYLDYVLPKQNYLTPYNLTNEVRIFRSKTDDMFYKNDMSDHFAQYGRLEYPFVVTQPQDVNVCQGNDTFIHVDASHPMYFTWFKNTDSIHWNSDTLALSNVSQADTGWYYCILSYSNGKIYSDTIRLNVLQAPSLFSLQTDSLCFGDSLLLSNVVIDSNGTSGTLSFWADSDCSVPIGETVFSSGTYFVKKTLATSCFDVVAVNVFVKAMIAAPIIYPSHDTLFSNYSMGNQWYNSSGIILGANNSFYIPLYSDTYYCIYTSGSCASVESNHLPVIIQGINETSVSDFLKIYPNPAQTGLLHIDLQTQTKAQLTVYDSGGKKIFMKDISKSTDIDISKFSKGVYMFILNADKQYLTKVIVQ